MPRSPSPAEATKALVTELRAQGLACSARRLEDWARVGLVPRGRRHSLGRGRGTEVVYPPEMVERCRLVAQRMRRGQPWQVVALCLFVGGIALPEETVRTAYRWALTLDVPPGEDELAAAERGVEQFLHTAGGRRLATLIATHVKRSGVAGEEPPSAVARSVLTNIFLSAFGGEPANDDAVIEVLAGFGLPVYELGPAERVELTRFFEAVIGSFSFEELGRVVDRTSIEELRGVLPVAAALLDLLPGDVRPLMPSSVVELLPGLLAPVLIQLRHLAEQLADQQLLPPAASQPTELSQGPATMEPMPTQHEARSA